MKIEDAEIREVIVCELASGQIKVTVFTCYSARELRDVLVKLFSKVNRLEKNYGSHLLMRKKN